MHAHQKINHQAEHLFQILLVSFFWEKSTFPAAEQQISSVIVLPRSAEVNKFTWRCPLFAIILKCCFGITLHLELRLKY